MLLMDFSKAFDKVPFKQTMVQIKSLGIGETVGLWIESWLYNNYYKVRMGEKLSQKRKLMASIKQGSVISPIHFTIFIESLLDALQRAGMENGSYYFFADDQHA